MLPTCANVKLAYISSKIPPYSHVVHCQGSPIAVPHMVLETLCGLPNISMTSPDVIPASTASMFSVEKAGGKHAVNGRAKT